MRVCLCRLRPPHPWQRPGRAGKIKVHSKWQIRAALHVGVNLARIIGMHHHTEMGKSYAATRTLLLWVYANTALLGPSACCGYDGDLPVEIAALLIVPLQPLQCPGREPWVSAHGVFTTAFHYH